MVETAEVTYAEPKIVPQLADAPLYPELNIASASPGFDVPTFSTGAQLMERVNWINDNQFDVQAMLEKYRAGKSFEIQQINDQKNFEREQFTRTEPVLEKVIAVAPLQVGAATEMEKAQVARDKAFQDQGVDFNTVAMGAGLSAESNIDTVKSNIERAEANAAAALSGADRSKIKTELDALETKKQFQENLLKEGVAAAIGGYMGGVVNSFHGAEPVHDGHGQIAGKAIQKPTIEKPEISQDYAATGKVTTSVGPQIQAAPLDTGHDDFQKAARVTQHAAIDSAEVPANPFSALMKGAGMDKIAFTLDGDAELPTNSPARRAAGFSKVQSTGMSLGRGGNKPA